MRHPRPQGFSFADDLAAALQYTTPTLPPPFAISYRVGSLDRQEGLDLDVCAGRGIGQPLVAVPLSLTRELRVRVELEPTMCGPPPTPTYDQDCGARQRPANRSTLRTTLCKKCPFS